MKKALKKPEIKEAEEIKPINQYKYFGLNLQKTGRLTAHIDSLKIKLKKISKMIFLLFKKLLYPKIFKNFFL
jgi:hypothetical protein